MKNSTLLTSVVLWFTTLGAIALVLASPEMFSNSGTSVISGHGFNGSVSKLTTIICTVVPFMAVAITLTISYVWHKETSQDKKIA